MANTEANFPFGLCKNDANFLKHFNSTLKELRTLVLSNIEYYQRGKSSIHACFYAACCILLERTQVLEPLVIEIVPKLHNYDLSEDVQANGYRSFVSIVNRCCIHLLQLCRHINVNKTSLLFRSSFYLKELEAYVETLGQLMACLGYLQQLMSHSVNGDLFLDDENTVGDDLLLEVEMLNTDCFYGRCLGFQFHESIQKTLKGVNVAMATFSECYEEKSQVVQLASSLLNGGKYFVDDHLRAKQVVDITRTADIKFCKAFWSITESPLLHHLRSFTFPHIQISEVMSLKPENFELPMDGNSNETVVITPPCAHTGPTPVKVRLISHAVREGMVDVIRHRFRPKTGSAKKTTVLEKSAGLLFHCHGGGFVAQSSQSHENYLRLWAQQLQMPILSVDYSLAPEQPFPRALEESFYAYAWALKNPEKLGWTGERVCFAGDSAGGNIVLSTALRAVSYQIQVPDGIMIAYTPTLVQYTPSPARLMSMIDPLLPVGILTRCLAAYAGIADKFSSAIAEPVFCNPGKYESWEVVTPEKEHVTVVGESTNQESCDKPQITNQGKGNKNSLTKENGCDLNAKSEFSCSKQDVQSGTGLVEESRSECSTGHKRKLTKCDSIENMTDDEFIVYDMDEADCCIQSNTVMVNKIDCDKPVIEKLERSGSVESDVIRQRLAEAMKENSRTTSEESISTGEPCLMGTGKAFDAAEEKNTKTDFNCQRSDSDRNIREMEESDVTTVQDFGSIEEMLTALDSNVSIQIDTSDYQHGSIDNTSEMGAVCQELLDNRDHSDNSDMNVSCHSLEDLTDYNQIDINSIETEVQEVETEVQVKCHRDIGPSLNENDSYARNNTKADFQLSDKLDGDVCNEENMECDMVQQNLMKPLSVTKSPSCPDCLISDINDKDFVMDKISESETEKENSLKSQNESDETVSNLNKHKRHLSLDLPVTYHPGQTSLTLEDQQSAMSRLSPALSPGSRSFTPKLFSVQRKIAQSPIKLFRQLPIVKNFYMSPLLAPDDLLMGLPEVHLAACHFDPLLDDSIMFAKKLRRLNKPVSLKVYDNLPHGFLNFYDASTEAKHATDGCLESIKYLLSKHD